MNTQKSIDSGITNEYEDIEEMVLSSRITLCAVLMVFMAGCSFHLLRTPVRTGFPERVYVIPPRNDFSKSRVAVFRFAEPPFAPNVGRAAAEAVYNELVRKDVFSQVLSEVEAEAADIENIMEIGRAKKYDLIITGDVLYYYDGSDLESSRVDEQIRVASVSTSETLWYAAAADVGQPALSTDFFLFRVSGAPAPAANVLLQRNAEKFCKMLLELPRQTFSAGLWRAFASVKEKKSEPGSSMR